MSVETILLLALGAVAVTVFTHWVADRTGLPEAALLTVLGIAYALLPGPNITLDPHVVLTFVLPPLLYNASLDSSLLGIRRSLRTVISLSVVLVLVTSLLIGLAFGLLVGGATIAAGIALGAAVAPPDPVAALAVGQRVGLPPRLITLIQGEGLLNDATALTTLTVAVAAATGGHFSFLSATGEFVLAAAGGVLVGVVVAIGVRLLRPITDDPLTTNAVSLATPFVAYLAGESVHVSGVLAVVVAGLIVGHDTPRSSSGASRLQTNAVWRLINFLLEGLVFLLIGQQLPEVIDGLHGYPVSTITLAVVLTVGIVLVLRPLWLVLTQLLPRSPASRLTAREVVVLSWAGTRGVISLAAIFTVPLTIDSGARFPDRDLLQFCTFVVVLVTLVGQGVTFAPLVRRLGMRADEADQARLRNQARSAAVKAALARLDEMASNSADKASADKASAGSDPADSKEVDAHEAGAVDRVRSTLQTRLSRYQGRIDALDEADGEMPVSPAYEAALRVRRIVIEAERDELLRLRDVGQLPDEGLRILERELDHEERLLPDRPSRGG